MSDADLSTPIEEVEKLYKALEDGCCIAIGSRAVSGSRMLKKQPWYRQFMGMTFNTFIRALAVIEIHDTSAVSSFSRRTRQRGCSPCKGSSGLP
jgi:dolichyl-phosphate beta-glucosyltransferase